MAANRGRRKALPSKLKENIGLLLISTIVVGFFIYAFIAGNQKRHEELAQEAIQKAEAKKIETLAQRYQAVSLPLIVDNDVEGFVRQNISQSFLMLVYGLNELLHKGNENIAVFESHHGSIISDGRGWTSDRIIWELKITDDQIKRLELNFFGIPVDVRESLSEYPSGLRPMPTGTFALVLRIDNFRKIHAPIEEADNLWMAEGTLLDVEKLGLTDQLWQYRFIIRTEE